MSTQDFERCLICSEKATQYFASNNNLPLCQLSSCEVALIAEINDELNAAAEAVKE